MMLVWIWEFWNWTDGAWQFLGAVLLLHFAFSMGVVYGSQVEVRHQPWWIQISLASLIAGVLMVGIPLDG